MRKLWPRYTADMHELKTKHLAATWNKLEDGNIFLTKSGVPFGSIGSDHACEHLDSFILA